MLGATRNLCSSHAFIAPLLLAVAVVQGGKVTYEKGFGVWMVVAAFLFTVVRANVTVRLQYGT